MPHLSTTEVAEKLRITQAALSKYIKAKKVPAPKMVTSGKMTIHLWTEEDVEELRQLLPKIANGRKTRYKKQTAVSTQQSAKPKSKAEAKRRSKPTTLRTGDVRCYQHRTRPDHNAYRGGDHGYEEAYTQPEKTCKLLLP